MPGSLHPSPMPMRASFLWYGLAVALCTIGRAAPATAQNAGAVSGVARNASDETPVAFAIVRLVSVESSAAGPVVVLTDSAGRYAIAGVRRGTYRIQLDRIGFERFVSPVFRVDDAVLRHDVLATPVPVRLSAMKIVPAGRCLSAAQLDEDSQLAALWREAIKGVEIRQAFELQYRFTRILAQKVKFDRQFMPDVRRERADTTTSEPDSVAARLRRLRDEHHESGYVSTGAGRFLVRLPDERELLADEFLRDHCLETAPEGVDGVVVLRFRPIEARPTGYGIRGAIWLDENFLIRRLEFDYLQGESAVIKSSVQYADIPITGMTVRLPAHGEAAGRPPELAMVNGISGTFTFTYAGFARVERP